MSKPVIVGEAPSKLGDGRPFTGPSGDRLQLLLGLKSYDELANTFEMVNIFEKVTQPAWDRFDRDFARKRAQDLLIQWADASDDGLLDVLLMGRKVMASFGVEHLPWFGFEQAPRGVCRIVLWAFPHPSGLSHFWNDQENVLMASRVLRARAIAHRTDHPSEHISLDLDEPQAASK